MNLFSLSLSLPSQTHIPTSKGQKHVDFTEGDKGLEMNDPPFNQWVELCFPSLSSRSTPSSSTQVLLQFLKQISSSDHCKSLIYSFVGTGDDQEYNSQAVLYWKILVWLFMQLLQFPWKLTVRKVLIWQKFSSLRKITSFLKQRILSFSFSNDSFKFSLWMIFFFFSESEMKCDGVLKANKTHKKIRLFLFIGKGEPLS